jgi:hypothetical protein
MGVLEGKDGEDGERKRTKGNRKEEGTVEEKLEMLGRKERSASISIILYEPEVT